MALRKDDSLSDRHVAASCTFTGGSQSNSDLVAHVQELYAMFEQGGLSRRDYERNVVHSFFDHLARCRDYDKKRILRELESLRIKGLISCEKHSRLAQYIARDHTGGTAEEKKFGHTTGTSARQIYGVKGLLCVVCAILALAFPLAGLVEMLLDWSTLQIFEFNQRLQHILASYFIADMVITGLFSVLFIVAGILMWRQSPSGIRLAKGLLLARMFVSFSELLYLQQLSIGGFKHTSIFQAEFTGIVLGTCLVGVLLLYLERSRQVRLTYALV